jgi:TonB family protein
MKPRFIPLAPVLAATVIVGCGGAHERSATARDSTGVISGQLLNTFVHGRNPFYGSVVYLIPVTPSNEDWWVGFARPRYALVDPQQDRWLGFDDRTTCSEGGRFLFMGVKPGDYYVYARVLWTTTIGDSTIFGGGPWLGEAKVAARETSRVTLRSRLMTFPQGIPPRRRFTSAQQPTDPDLPRFGEYVYVEDLPKVVTRVEPEYPADARRDGIDGTVFLQVLVGKDGFVKDIRIAKSTPRLDQAAVTAVRKWVFRPALTNNKPVAVWIGVPVRFSRN